MKIVDRRESGGYEDVVRKNPGEIHSARYNSVRYNTIFDDVIRSATLELVEYGTTVYIYRKTRDYETRMMEGFFVCRVSVFDRVPARYKHVYATLRYDGDDTVLEIRCGFLASEYGEMYRRKGNQ